MATNTNRVVLAGTLVRDPEEIANGKGCQFSIAVNESFKKDEEWQEYCNFFDVVVWGNGAKPVLNHLAKGSRVVVDGRLKQERWEKDGQKNQRVKIHSTSVEFMPKSTQQSKGSSGASDATEVADDEDIPF